MEQPSTLPPEQSKDEPADKIGFRSRLLRWGIVLFVAVGILLIPVPEGITPQSWRLLAIFGATSCPNGPTAPRSGCNALWHIR